MNLKPTGCRWALLLSIVLLLSVGCGDGKGSAELEQSKRAIEKLTLEKNRLQEQISQLQGDFDALQSEFDNSKVKETELAQWSQQLAERFGPGVWYVGNNERPLPIKSIPNATADLLVTELNALFTQSQLPQLILQQINGNTAHVRISDDRQLTQQMGSAGATAYIQAVTYTLTSLPGVAYVDFEFQEGDHAAPGRYTR